MLAITRRAAAQSLNILETHASSIGIRKLTVPAPGATPSDNDTGSASVLQQLQVQLPYLSDGETTHYLNVPPLDTSDAVLQRIADKIDSGFMDNFMVCDVGRLRQRYELWQDHLPRVQPFYAVKCNDHRRILEVLASLGCGFDCASELEIENVLPLVQPSDVIFANPCKPQSHLKKAAERKVSLLTFDSSDELAKISECYPEAQCVLRLATDDKDAVQPMSVKFGAELTEAASLLTLARSYDLDVVGVSFHCSSNNKNPASYRAALDDSRTAFELGAQAGYDFKLLDIGGGFPGSTHEDPIFAEIANAMQFDDFDDDVRIIAEPGRFFVASTQTLVTRVYSLKKYPDGSFAYYINDGLYGSFNSILYDYAVPIARKFTAPGTATSDQPETFPSTIFGPTCDGLDCIAKNVALPRMERDDWFFFENMGAYTNVGGSRFNGMPRPEFEFVD